MEENRDTGREYESKTLKVSAIVIAVIIAVFCVIALMIRSYKNDRQERERDKRRSIDESFRRDMEKYYGLKEGDYKITSKKYEEPERAEYKFTVDGVEYVARRVSDFYTNFRMYDCSEDVKGYVDASIREAGLLGDGRYSISAICVDWNSDLQPMRFTKKEVAKYFADNSGNTVWYDAKVIITIDVEQSDELTPEEIRSEAESVIPMLPGLYRELHVCCYKGVGQERILVREFVTDCKFRDGAFTWEESVAEH